MHARLIDGVGERASEQARDRQRQLGLDAGRLATMPPPNFHEPLDGSRHVVVVDAYDDDVASVVRDRRPQGAGLKAEAAYEAEADAAGSVVALDDGDLREVAAGI